MYERGNIKTSRNPEYIYDSCNLIKKYTDNIEINIISLDDDKIPFYCNKANEKYNQLFMNMLSDKDYINAMNYFKTKSLIFIDSKLLSDNKIYYDEYRGIKEFEIKIKNLENFKKFAKELISENSFKKIDSGKQLSVFKKN